MDENVDQPLLGGDYEEELRQSERLKQKDKNALEGANTRLDEQTVAQLEVQSARTYSWQKVRTGSIESFPGNPQNRFDPKLKHELMQTHAI